jgi:tetratricopeptide (TPR) repeat protein
LRAPVELPAGEPVTADNRSRLVTTWLREPLPLPEKRFGPALLVLHAGEPLPHLPVPVQALDLRAAAADLVAAYAIFRRYWFDYRADLATPLWTLIDSAGRVRKVYAEAPEAADAEADLRAVDGPVPDARALPFGGVYHGLPGRDYFKIGGAMLMAGYGEYALPYLEEASRRSPSNAKTLVAIGRIHLEANRLERAREILTRASVLDPALPEAWNELGGVESAAGNGREALRLYERALELGPNLAYVMVNAGNAQETLDNAAEAERFYRRALAADARSGDAANRLGLLLAKAGRTDEARHWLEEAIAIRRDDASAINNLAVLYMNTGQNNDAIAAFQYGIRVAPDEDILYLNLSRTWLRMGQREKARDTMRQLLARKPGLALAERALRELDTE